MERCTLDPKMHSIFFAAVGLFLLIESTLAVSNSQALLVKGLMCGRMSRKKGDKIVVCVDSFEMPDDLKKYDPIIDACCSGVHLTDEGGEIRGWVCGKRTKALAECASCVVDKVPEADQDKIVEMLDPFKDCVMEAVTS